MSALVAQMEQSLVAQLCAAFTLPGNQHPALDVRAWPSKPDTFKSTHAVGSVLVMFYGKKNTTGGLNGALLDVVYSFKVLAQVRTLREHQLPQGAPENSEMAGATDLSPASGAYDTLELIERTLEVFTPLGATQVCQISKAGFVGYGEGLWQFEVDVQVPARKVISRPCPPGVLPVGAGGCCSDPHPVMATNISLVVQPPI